MSLTNCEVNLTATWPVNQVIFYKTGETLFDKHYITNTKLYAPVVTL